MSRTTDNQQNVRNLINQRKRSKQTTAQTTSKPLQSNCNTVHTHMHTHIHTYTHTHIHTNTHTYIYIYIDIYTNIHTYLHTYVHAFLQWLVLCSFRGVICRESHRFNLEIQHEEPHDGWPPGISLQNVRFPGPPCPVSGFVAHKIKPEPSKAATRRFGNAFEHLENHLDTKYIPRAC
jgi:hypothetical protein